MRGGLGVSRVHTRRRGTVERDGDPGDEQAEGDPHETLARVPLGDQQRELAEVLELDREVEARGRCRPRATDRRPGRARWIGWPSARCRDLVRDDQHDCPTIGGAIEQSLQAQSRPGTPIRRTASPSAASVIGTGASHRPRRRRRGGSGTGPARTRSDGTCSPDRQRVVDPVVFRAISGRPGKREVGHESVGGRSRTRRIERDVLDQQETWRADRLDRQRLALGDDQALLIAKSRRGSGRDEEEDQPGVREQRRHLGVLVTIAIQEARAVGVGRLPDAEAVAPQDGVDRVRRDPAIAARSGSRGSK